MLDIKEPIEPKSIDQVKALLDKKKNQDMKLLANKRKYEKEMHDKKQKLKEEFTAKKRQLDEEWKELRANQKQLEQEMTNEINEMMQSDDYKMCQPVADQIAEIESPKKKLMTLRTLRTRVKRL